MPTNYHKIVLGILANIPSSLELYSRLVNTADVFDLPVILSQIISQEHEQLLHDAGLANQGLVDGIQLFFANDEFAYPPQDLFQQLLDHNSELFWSLANDYLSQGHILMAQSLHGTQDAEITQTKLMLRHCQYRLHLINLPLVSRP